MESRAHITSVELVEWLVKESATASHTRAEALPTYPERASAQPASSSSCDCRTLLRWQSAKSMGAAPSDVPVVGDTAQLSDIRGTRLVTFDNTSVKADQQLLYASAASRWIGSFRLSVDDVARGRHGRGNAFVMTAISADLHFVASHTPIDAEACTHPVHDIAVAYKLAVLQKKLVSWLFQHLSTPQLSSKRSVRMHVSLDELAGMFPSLLVLDPESRNEFVERAIDRYARGMLSVFDKSVICLVGRLDASSFGLVDCAEMRASQAFELALSSLAQHAGGRSLNEMMSSLHAVYARLLATPTKDGSSTTSWAVTRTVAIVLQTLAPFLSMNTRRETPWLMPLSRSMHAILVDGDAGLHALLVSAAKKKGLASGESFAVMDEELWRACVKVVTHRKSLGGVKGETVVGDGRAGGAAPGEVALPSVVLGNQASAFFSVLPSSVEDGADDSERAPDTAAATSGVRDQFSHVAIGVHPHSLRVVSAAPGNSDLVAMAPFDDAWSLRLFHSVCDRWPKTGPPLTTALNELLATATKQKASDLVIPVAAGHSHKKRRPLGQEEQEDDLRLEREGGDKDVTAYIAVRARAAMRRVEPS